MMRNNRCYAKKHIPLLIWALTIFCPLIVLSATDAALGREDKGHVKSLDGIPEDLHIVYGTGATHAEWGRSTYEISANGRVVYEETRGSRTGGSSQKKYYRITKKEIQHIVKQIRKNHFFSLNSRYSNPKIRDGWSSHISVRMDNQTHTVSVMNVSPPEFSAIAHVIKNVIYKKKPVKHDD